MLKNFKPIPYGHFSPNVKPEDINFLGIKQGGGYLIVMCGNFYKN